MSLLIYEFMEKSAKEHPDTDAIRWLVKKDIHSITYSDLVKNMVNIRRALVDEGYTHTHVAIIGSTCMEWMEAYLGLVSGTCTAIPLDAAMPKDELFELIRRADATGIFLGKDLAAWIPEVFEACPQVRRVWFIDGEAPADDRVGTLAGLIEKGASCTEDALPAADDTAMIIFTSGTTGLSKGVMLSHGNIAENVEPQVVSHGVGVPMLNVLPVHHAFCLVMDWLRGFANAAIVCINDSYMHIVRNMSIFKPVSTLMVPLMIETIYKRIKNTDPSVPKEAIYQKVFGGSLRRIYAGGAHLDPYYIDKFAEYGILVLEGYGMSECSPCISANMAECYKPGSVGKPLKNVVIKIDEETGEILVKGSSVMQKYYKMPEETAAALQEGWLHTGDKGYLDEEGFLYINGRLKNLIILANGENISPEEIENKLALNDLIGEVIIAGEDHGLIAHVYPDPDVVGAKGLSEEQVAAGLQKILDDYNEGRPSYHQIVGLKVRKYPFIKNATKKIKRMEIHRDEPTV